MCSCSIFSHFRSFSPWWPLAFLYSHRRENIFMFLLRTKLVSFLLSLLSLSMHTMTTKVGRKTRLCCCLIVPSKSPGGHAIYRLNVWLLEMKDFSTAYEGTEDFFRTKIYWMYNRTFANGQLSTTATFFRPCGQKIVHDSCLKPLYNGNFLLSPRWPL